MSKWSTGKIDKKIKQYIAPVEKYQKTLLVKLEPQRGREICEEIIITVISLSKCSEDKPICQAEKNINKENHAKVITSC